MEEKKQVTDAEYTDMVLTRYFDNRPPVVNTDNNSNLMSSDDIRIALDDIWQIDSRTITAWMFDHGYYLFPIGTNMKWAFRDLEDNK